MCTAYNSLVEILQFFFVIFYFQCLKMPGMLLRERSGSIAECRVGVGGGGVGGSLANGGESDRRKMVKVSEVL